MKPEELAAKLDPDALKSELERTMQRIVLLVEANVKRNTPVRTGNLRRSITSRVEASGERGIVGTNVVYARRVNARRGYMEQGLEESVSAVEQMLQEAGERFFVKVA